MSIAQIRKQVLFHKMALLSLDIALIQKAFHFIFKSNNGHSRDIVLLCYRIDATLFVQLIMK